MCAAGSRLPSGAPAAQDGSTTEAALHKAQLCNGSAACSAAESNLVADVSAFVTAVAALPNEWGAAGVDPFIKETICAFLLRLLAAATAGRALEPDLARSGLPALHAKAAAELAALQRGREGGPSLVAALASGLLDALRQVPVAKSKQYGLLILRYISHVYDKPYAVPWLDSVPLCARAAMLACGRRSSAWSCPYRLVDSIITM